MYKIEKNIPYPKAADRKYPFSEMKIGDSFFVPFSEMKNRSVIALSASYHGRKSNRKYRTQKTEDGNGIRCWRIK